MRNGLIISVLLHAGILVYALGFLPLSGKKDLPPPAPVPVDLVTPSELTRIKAGRKDAKKKKTALKDRAKKAGKPDRPRKKIVKKKAKPKPKPKKKAVRAKRAPKKSEPVRKAEKKAKPSRPKKPVKKAAPQKTVPQKTAPKKMAKVKPKPKPKVKPKPSPAKKTTPPVRKAMKTPKRSYEDEMAALLNKLPDEDSAPELAGREASRKKPPRPDELAQGRRFGMDEMMSASEIDAFRAQIARCWNPPVGGLGSEALAVKLRLQLHKNGAIAKPPRLMNRQASPFFQAAADSAIRAVLQCQPYTMPKHKYATWRDMVLTFDPREMMGGF